MEAARKPLRVFPCSTLPAYNKTQSSFGEWRVEGLPRPRPHRQTQTVLLPVEIVGEDIVTSLAQPAKPALAKIVFADRRHDGCLAQRQAKSPKLRHPLQAHGDHRGGHVDIHGLDPSSCWMSS
jgi:hypothetical protein